MKKTRLIILLIIAFTVFGCKTSKLVKTRINDEIDVQVVHKKIIYELYCDSIQKEKVGKWTLECMENSNPKRVSLISCSEEAERIFCAYKKGIYYTTGGTSYFVPCDEIPSSNKEDCFLCKQEK